MSILTRLQRSTFALPVAALMALALLLISEGSFRKSRNAAAELTTKSAVRVDVKNVLGYMVDAETAQRGYLLTGRAEYLAPYRDAVRALPTALAQLHRHYAEQGDLDTRMAQLDEMIQRRLSYIDESIRMYDAGQNARWHELLLSNIGKEQMDAVREITGQMLAAEAQGIASARQDIDDVALISRIGIAIMAMASLLVLKLYLQQRATLEGQVGALRESVRAELQSQVDTGNREMAELAQYLLTAREDERSRLARAMHDELGALLTAAKLDVARIKMRVTTASPEALERLAHLNETLNSVVALSRRITEDLRPSSLGNLGLVPALEILARDFAAGADLQVDCALQAVALNPQRQLTVYRLVQEGLTNIAKYAQAQSVRVTLAPRGGQAVVSVTDDGAGFDMNTAKMGSYGLLGMRHRVEGEGGRLVVESTPGAGTRLSATLPLDIAPDTAPYSKTDSETDTGGPMPIA